MLYIRLPKFLAEPSPEILDWLVLERSWYAVVAIEKFLHDWGKYGCWCVCVCVCVCVIPTSEGPTLLSYLRP